VTMITSDQITTLMRDRLEAVRDPAVDLSDDAAFQDLGITSLDLANFVFSLEDEFDVELDPSMAADIHTIGDLVRVANESLADAAKYR
jgi:acyl carrier protein